MQIWHLTKVYWYTVEFGVVMEGGQPKAFGAGVLSSFGELEHMAQGKATLVPFDPFAKQVCVHVCVSAPKSCVDLIRTFLHWRWSSGYTGL